MQEKIAIVGLGYVGLPLALAIARKFPGTIGFDVNEAKLAALRDGRDPAGDMSPQDLKRSSLIYSSKAKDLAGCTLFLVAVPTPVDQQKRPDFTPLVKASETVGKALKKGAIVCYESTVYPGVTEEICGPVLERASGLKRSVDFKLAYSPERINPGDKEHTFERVTKVVAGEDAETLERVSGVYASVVPAGIHRAPSIKVAEAAKVIENTQRDLNIALMNELALIFDRLDIRTRDVLDAAGTKWNFLKFHPGLVGGHCIGVDPYYLTAKAEEVGYHPQVILAGRRINDGMGAFVGQKAVKMLAQSGRSTKGARVGILGVTFKENVPDLRNSRIPDIVAELREFAITPLTHDPLANPHDAQEEYGLQLSKWEDFKELDALIVAVPHKFYLEKPPKELFAMLKKAGILLDIKSVLKPSSVPAGVTYWSL
ncbi:MAG TPA: nucleotide sugar dehydrogenase [Planctomycetota bacterium]|nr:nucleotide sugar dehydrogenase [Planctomycetota bacterium]